MAKTARKHITSTYVAEHKKIRQSRSHIVSPNASFIRIFIQTSDWSRLVACCVLCNLIFFVTVYTVDLPDAVTLGGAYDGGRTSPVGLRDHMTFCSGR